MTRLRAKMRIIAGPLFPRTGDKGMDCLVHVMLHCSHGCLAAAGASHSY